TATFHAVGTYTFLATITDPANLTATSSITVTVSQTLTSVVVSPASASITTGATQQFTASGKDQFGNTLTTQPAWTWTMTGIGTLTSAGLYTAPASTGTATVKATSGSVFNTAAVTVSAQTQILTSLTLLPGSITLGPGQQQAFTPWAKDQFGKQMTVPYTFSIVSGGGTISNLGVYTAPATSGTATVRVTAGSLTATASITTDTTLTPGIFFDSTTGILTIRATGYSSQATVNVGTINGVQYAFVGLSCMDSLGNVILSQ